MTFRGTLVHQPYFFVYCGESHAREVSSALSKRFEGLVLSVETNSMEDLELPNHVAGYKANYLKLSFRTVSELMDLRRELRPRIERNRRRAARDAAFETGAVRPSPSSISCPSPVVYSQRQSLFAAAFIHHLKLASASRPLPPVPPHGTVSPLLPMVPPLLAGRRHRWRTNRPTRSLDRHARVRCALYHSSCN